MSMKYKLLAAACLMIGAGLVPMMLAAPASAAKSCVMAAYLVPSEDVERFNRHWRHLLAKHELPLSEPGGWREIAARRAKAGHDAVSSFAAAGARYEALPFVVGIDHSTWSKLGSARQLFGTPQMFCFLRLMRQVLDRMEAVEEKSAITVMFARDVDDLIGGANAAMRLYKTDTRAPERVQSITFTDPRRDCVFAAVDLLIHMSLSRITVAQERTGTRLSQALQIARDLPPLPDDVTVEMWDEAYSQRHLASLEWGMSGAVAGRKRKARQS